MPDRRDAARPAYRQPLLLLLVLLGGATGTLARWATGLAVPHLGRVPLGTLAVNVIGAFVLGALLAHLAGRGPDEGRRRALRVTLGTGFCGGFTTYSALANDTAGLLRQGLAGHALAYVGATLVLGYAASVLGVAAARRTGRTRATA
ncbi:fluoride efflux transporter FluC [Microlunatus flavus]|uniref:Fluoride-specific ion channel FluC n=1 Tax=Microlunatus flavus TaxID=1036181 RepID=A0A1H8ZAY3_9ACTN|nr:CrcB family protein [Microlunatus flavus]SEP61491.1 CrcB protein [Microlunatus flavus]